MAIAIDTGNIAVGTVAASATLTKAQTIVAGIKRLVVGLQWKDFALTDVSGITFNAVPLTALGAGSIGGSGDRCRLWELAAPDVGTFNIVVTFSGDPVGGAVLGTWPLFDAGAPTVVTDSQSTTNVTITVPSSPSGMVVVVGAAGNALTPVSGTQDWNTFGVAGHFGVGAHGAGASVTLAWSQGTPDLWEMMAASFPALTDSPSESIRAVSRRPGAWKPGRPR